MFAKKPHAQIYLSWWYGNIYDYGRYLYKTMPDVAHGRPMPLDENEPKHQQSPT